MLHYNVTILDASGTVGLQPLPARALDDNENGMHEMQNDRRAPRLSQLRAFALCLCRRARRARRLCPGLGSSRAIRAPAPTTTAPAVDQPSAVAPPAAPDTGRAQFYGARYRASIRRPRPRGHRSRRPTFDQHRGAAAGSSPWGMFRECRSRGEDRPDRARLRVARDLDGLARQDARIAQRAQPSARGLAHAQQRRDVRSGARAVAQRHQRRLATHAGSGAGNPAFRQLARRRAQRTHRLAA